MRQRPGLKMVGLDSHSSKFARRPILRSRDCIVLSTIAKPAHLFSARPDRRGSLVLGNHDLQNRIILPLVSRHSHHGHPHRNFNFRDDPADRSGFLDRLLHFRRRPPFRLDWRTNLGARA